GPLLQAQVPLPTAVPRLRQLPPPLLLPRLALAPVHHRRRQVAQRAVQPLLVVPTHQTRQDPLRRQQVAQLLPVQRLPKGPDRTPAPPFPPGPGRTDPVRPQPVPPQPLQELPRDETAAVVRLDLRPLPRQAVVPARQRLDRRLGRHARRCPVHAQEQ